MSDFKKDYVPPEVCMLFIDVEAGFAISGDAGGYGGNGHAGDSLFENETIVNI